MKSSRATIWIVLALITIGAVLRVIRYEGFLPLPPNVAPVSALAFLAAAYLPRRWGWAVPIGLMAVSDMVIGGYDLRIMAAVYASFGLSFLLGLWLRSRRSIGRLATVALAGSIGFFLLTNAAVWLWGRLYLPTMAGLVQAYMAGLPFLRNTVIGDLAYTFGFFGLAEGVMVYWRRHVAEPRVTTYG